MPRLNLYYDIRRDVAVIEGVQYSGDLFRNLATFLPEGATFRLVKREDGVLFIEQLDPPPPDRETR